MKKIFNFSKKQKDSPSTSETGSALSAGYALKEKDLSKVHKAAFTGDVAKLKQLAKKNDLNQLDKENRTALHIACAHGHAEAVRFLVEKKVKLNLCDNQNRSALMKAVQCQQDRCVTILLEHEADPNLVDLNGNTALHLAARIPSIPVALQLLEHEANINARNKEGNTPLILSVEENHADMAEFLLKEGADVNIKNQEQRSSLLIAACNGHINMVRLLLQFNADITVKDKKGWTSDDYAVMNGHHACSHLIIEHGTKRKQLQSPAHLPSGKKKPTSLLSSPEAGFAIRGPALDKDDAEDSSLAGSISRASRSGAADSWPSSDDDDELDLSPKKPQKVNLKKLIHASKKEGNTVTNQDLEKYWSGTDSEPISEDNAAEQLICPASISSSQHPVNPTPTSYNNLPQMMSTSLVSSQKEREKSSSEDEYEEEDEEECDEAENQRSDEEVEFTQKAHTSKDKQRELGFEKDNGEESPWDSESGSDSPRKRDQSGVNIPAKLHKAMASICEKTEEERSLEEKDDDEEKPEMQQKLRHREPVSVLSKMLNSKQNETKRDFLEELGLGDVDDLEDASDWDSASTTSKASKNILITNPGEELAGEHLLVLPVVQEQEPPTSSSEAKEEEKSKPSTSAVPPLPSPRSFIPITHAHPQPKPQLRSQKNKEPNSDEESDWDTDSTSSPLKMTTPPSKLVENKAVTPVADKANLDNSEHSKKEGETLDALKINVSSPQHLASSESQPPKIAQKQQKEKERKYETTWEQRYEKLWVEIEKKETKSQYKNVAAELKEMFGEIEQKLPNTFDQNEEEKAVEEKKQHPESSECISESSSEDEEERIVQPTARTRNLRLLSIPEQRESDLEEAYSEDHLHNAFVRGHDLEQLSPDTAQIENFHQGCDHKMIIKFSTNIGENKEHCRSPCKNDVEANFVRNQEYYKEADPLLLVNESKVSQSKPDEFLCNSDEEVEEGLHSSMMKDEVAKADVMKGRHKTLGNNLGSGRHTDCDQGKSKKADTNTEQPKPQQEESCDGGSTQKDEGFKTVDSISPEGLTRLKSSPPIHSIDGKTAKEDDETSDQCNLLKVPAPKKSKAVYHVNHRNGKSGLDDSTLSEVSDDELRPASRQGAEKVPVQRGGEPELADDFDDLTQSSDTATDELDSAVPGYIHASLLLKQLDTCILDSVSMVKLQNMFHEYDRTIQKERSRHGRLTDKVSQLEQERNEVKLLLKESKESKSSLEGVRLELETELNHLKFMLKQEQEKHHGASILCEKVREQLRRKEEEQQAEMEEHHKMELKIRSLELEIRGLMNNMKQMEEDRNEAQRLVAHERSARALQEDLMNSHLRKQQDFEEKHLRNVNKSNELPEASEREKELQHLVTTLQEELSLVRAELERSRTHSLEEESRLADERDALQERLDDARRDLKLNEESLAQTVLQYNGQISTLKSECTLLSSKLEHERQLRQQVEAEAEASRARLQSALEETEKCQVARADAERTLQRERDKHQRAEEKWASESRTQGDTVQSLSQKLSEAEARSNNLENDCHRAMLSIAEKTVLVETASRECQQFRSRIEKLEGELQSERERSSSASGRHDAIQERLAQMQSENALLRQHLEEAQNRGTAKEQAVTDAQERFTQALNQLRADGEERVQLVEERSKELVTKNTELREHNYKLEQEKAERESSLRQLQQELADSLKKLAMCEASLEVNTRYRSELVEEKGRTQKEMDRLRAKFQDSEELYLQAERRINTLKGTLDEKERDLISASQKLQEALAATGSTEQTIKQLEEAVQSLEIENARLEATIKQQNNRIEILQKEAQEATALSDSSPDGLIRHQLEDLVTNLQSSKMGLQDQLSHEMQKQNVLTNNAQDSQALWEDELKSRSRISLRLAELEKEKGEFNNQIELQKKKAKKIAEQKRAVDARLDQEIQRNTELQKETYRLRTLVKTAKKKLREKDGGELDSSVGSPRREPSLRHSETEEAVSRMKIKVDGLHVQLEREVLRCSHLEKVNRELKEQLGSLKSFSRSQERLERSKQQLEEEVVDLRRRLEGGVMDYSQAEQFRRQTEERARQEIQHKLDEVNLFLQTQAASQEALEQMKTVNEARQKAELEKRINELEAELSRARSIQQDSLLQSDSSRTELERYRQLYNDELRHRKSLASKLERANERLAETNAKLLGERHRSTSLLSSSMLNGSLGGPALDGSASLGPMGVYGASLGPLNNRLLLGASLLGPTREPQTERVEDFLAKMQSKLERNISKELECATVELEGVSARVSPVGSASGSQKSLNLNGEQQDLVSRATQQYLEVLKKNYMV